jgi:hypothetical protein
VPSIWRLEVANRLQTGIRREPIDMDDRDAALSDLALLDIAIDPDTDRYAWTGTLRLADRVRLTLYGASYLEMMRPIWSWRSAARCRLPPWTLRFATRPEGWVSSSPRPRGDIAALTG